MKSTQKNKCTLNHLFVCSNSTSIQIYYYIVICFSRLPVNLYRWRITFESSLSRQTLEAPSCSCVSFGEPSTKGPKTNSLDVTISLLPNKFEFEMYRKKTALDALIHGTSSCPFSRKNSMLFPHTGSGTWKNSKLTPPSYRLWKISFEIDRYRQNWKDMKHDLHLLACPRNVQVPRPI